MMHDDGSSTFWNFLHVSGMIYGICFTAGMIVAKLFKKGRP